jgi:hypothetical protein
MSIRKSQYGMSGLKSGVAVALVHWSMGPVQAATPSQQPSLRVRSDS